MSARGRFIEQRLWPGLFVFARIRASEIYEGRRPWNRRNRSALARTPLFFIFFCISRRKKNLGGCFYRERTIEKMVVQWRGSITLSTHRDANLIRGTSRRRSLENKGSGLCHVWSSWRLRTATSKNLLDFSALIGSGPTSNVFILLHRVLTTHGTYLTHVLLNLPTRKE